MTSMQSMLLLFAAAFVVWVIVSMALESRVTFLYSEVLQLIDMTHFDGEPFNCDDGCTVYLDQSSDNMFISENGKEIANFTDFIGDSSAALQGIELPRTPTLPSSLSSRTAWNLQSRYVTFLSSARALNLNGFTGDFSRLKLMTRSYDPEQENGDLFTAGFDAVVADVYGATPCSPVYTSRSQQNAYNAKLIVMAPLVTVYFNVYGGVKANTRTYETKHKNATAIVYMSPGYVGCPFVLTTFDTGVYTNQDDGKDNFLQASNSLYNADGNSSTFTKHYDKGVYDFHLSWFSTPSARWTMQIDFEYESAAPTTTSTTLPTTTTFTTPPTTTSGSTHSLLISVAVITMFLRIDGQLHDFRHHSIYYNLMLNSAYDN